MRVLGDGFIGVVTVSRGRGCQDFQDQGILSVDNEAGSFVQNGLQSFPVSHNVRRIDEVSGISDDGRVFTSIQLGVKIQMVDDRVTLLVSLKSALTENGTKNL